MRPALRRVSRCVSLTATAWPVWKDVIVRELRQAWWARVAAVLVLAQLWVGAAFIYGEGTSNVLDGESRAAGVLLGFGGAAALGVGLWLRLRSKAAGDGLIVVGALLGGIWLWTVVMTPLALLVLLGLVQTELRSRTPRLPRSS